MRIKSLTARVLLLTTVWSTVALVVIGLLISTLYRKSAERGFQDLLRAQLYNVINSVTIGDQGALSGSPQLGDLRFAQPKTGWYWVVEPLGTYTTAPLVSPPATTSRLAPAATSPCAMAAIACSTMLPARSRPSLAWAAVTSSGVALA